LLIGGGLRDRIQQASGDLLRKNLLDRTNGSLLEKQAAVFLFVFVVILE
jgi:hypothetical protein